MKFWQQSFSGWQGSTVIYIVTGLELYLACKSIHTWACNGCCFAYAIKLFKVSLFLICQWCQSKVGGRNKTSQIGIQGSPIKIPFLLYVHLHCIHIQRSRASIRLLQLPFWFFFYNFLLAFMITKITEEVHN